MDIYIKNMVCVRCSMAVQSVLEELEICYDKIELGKVSLAGELTSLQQKMFDERLKHFHLELMEDKKKVLVERIKVLIIELFQSTNDAAPVKFSDYLSQSLYYDYTYMANTFTEIEGITIEKFYILTRIERIKELIIYEEMSLKEIAFELYFSSVSHLCLQFKKVTGTTPTEFRKLFESGQHAWRICERQPQLVS